MNFLYRTFTVQNFPHQKMNQLLLNFGKQVATTMILAYDNDDYDHDYFCCYCCCYIPSLREPFEGHL